jgi:hypothetical protein
VASAVRAQADQAAAFAPQLSASAEGAAGWAVGRARTAVQALFDTLDQAASDAEAGLRRVADQVAAAGGAYDAAEQQLLRPR